jgi:hypothetical protein
MMVRLGGPRRGEQNGRVHGIGLEALRGLRRLDGNKSGGFSQIVVRQDLLHHREVGFAPRQDRDRLVLELGYPVLFSLLCGGARDNDDGFLAQDRHGPGVRRIKDVRLDDGELYVALVEGVRAVLEIGHRHGVEPYRFLLLLQDVREGVEGAGFGAGWQRDFQPGRGQDVPGRGHGQQPEEHQHQPGKAAIAAKLAPDIGRNELADPRFSLRLHVIGAWCSTEKPFLCLRSFCLGAMRRARPRSTRGRQTQRKRSVPLQCRER